MPIRLRPPAYRPGGPDGQGWNRLSLNAHIGSDERPQCALRPRTYPQLWESQDTRRARWGGWGACTRPDDSTGDPCGGCLVLAREPRELASPDRRVLVRIREGTPVPPFGRVDEPWVMGRPDGGWEAPGEPWSWEDLVRVRGWRIGRRHVDEHSDGFWLEREDRKE